MDEDEDEMVIGAHRWSWMTPPILAAIAVANICEAVTDAVTGLATSLASHSNWQRNQDEFRREAAAAIERITDA